MSQITKQILYKAVSSPMFSKEVLPKAPLSIFEDNEIYKEISNVIKRYYQTNRAILTEDTLLTLIEDKLDRMKKSSEVQQEYFNIVNNLYEIRNSSDDSVIDEKIENYIKKHMRIDLLRKAALNVENEEFMEDFDRQFKEIMLLDVSGKKQEIINIVDDHERKRNALMSINRNTVSTGFSQIDYLNGGGLAKGELGLVVASSGTGKTLVLTNLATNYTKRSQNVLFVALEELENKMILRFEQAMLRQNKSTFLNGNVLNETRYGQMQEFYKKHRQNFGNLFFTRFSPRSITPAKIEQIISDIMIREGINIDVVLIDYPELLRNPQATGNEAEDGGKLFEEMRRIGQDYNAIMWTAAQMNRTAYSAQVRTAEHMEGSHRKKNAAELVLTINQTPEEYNAGFMRMYADKVRNTPDGPFDRMLGFKVVGTAMTVRDFKDDTEREEHAAVLEEADNNMQNSFKGKKQTKQQEAPDWSSEINSVIKKDRGA